MVSSNHSFWCSGVASRTPQRRIWENNSSRACSNSVGVDILRGSERFLAMRGVLLSSARDRERGDARSGSPAQAADQTAPQCNKTLRTAQRAAMSARGGIIIRWETTGVGVAQADT